eukprot:TRINITY_DN13649_c0_g1_i3.p1 TRINITY_DN13649_c0_g1~~TRINITY_DN13649_c0_g1_i3.p1  ORF type:complete len:398 (+),score=91.82 TRINITY_DN13649_c0_g1_i3:146-1339(+)
MMKVSFLLPTVMLLAIATHCEVCSDKELVFNGDFSSPKISTPWTVLGNLPGGAGTWSTLPPQNGFSLWQQGAEGCPAVGSYGEPTGQHLSINGNEPWAAVSYQTQTPCLVADTQATFYFEYWFNPGCGCDQLEFSIEQQGKQVVSEMYEGSSTEGWKNASGSFELLACQPVKLIFTSTANGNAGVHIDHVSLNTKECSDVEMVTGGDFEVPAIVGGWESVSTIPNGEGVWSISSSYILWKAGAMGSPLKNAQGKSVGQFLELNGASTKAMLGYKFFTPYLLGTAKANVNFLYWIREAGDECTCNNLNYFGYSVEQGGKLLKNVGLVSSTEGGWNAVSVTLDLKPAQSAHLYFTADTNAIGGVFIDAVSVTITEVRDVGVDVQDSYEESELQLSPVAL